jgi:hypothetical protein
MTPAVSTNNVLNLQIFGPISTVMRHAATRRTPAARVRQEISDILDQLYAIEDAMAVFERRHEASWLARAGRDYDAMLIHVDRLGELLRELRRQHAVPHTAEPTP